MENEDHRIRRISDRVRRAKTFDDLVGFLQVLNDGLADNEEYQIEQEEGPPPQELKRRDPAPHYVSHEDETGVANQLRVLIPDNNIHIFRKVALEIHNDMLDEVVNASQTARSHPRAPNQAVQNCWNQRRCFISQSFYDVLVSGEHVVYTVVVAITVCPNAEEVLDDCFGPYQFSITDGPSHERDR